MKQLLDGLEASGLKPIVIDENFDFSRLGELRSPEAEWNIQLQSMPPSAIAKFLMCDLSARQHVREVLMAEGMY